MLGCPIGHAMTLPCVPGTLIGCGFERQRVQQRCRSQCCPDVEQHLRDVWGATTRAVPLRIAMSEAERASRKALLVGGTRGSASRVMRGMGVSGEGSDERMKDLC